MNWRKPKRQIFFKEHTKGSVLKQNNVCAGCSKSIQSGWWVSPPYCRYSGKYFCTNCHKNSKYLIPARILHHWDFKHYPISEFYYSFLKEMYHEPLFDIHAINPGLFNTVPQLKKIKTLRQQLRYMKDFILTCRHKDSLTQIIGNRFYLVDTEFYSLADLVEISKHKFLSWLRGICETWVKHIINCELCRVKGSICGFCKSSEIIYPWNLLNTTQCPRCKSIAHRACYHPEKCPKCLRIQVRKVPKSPRKLSANSQSPISPRNVNPKPKSKKDSNVM